MVCGNADGVVIAPKHFPVFLEAAAHQQGKQIFAWTVNSMSEVRSLCNLHVDSIITDDPVMVQNVISRDSTGETLRSVLDYFIN